MVVDSSSAFIQKHLHFVKFLFIGSINTALDFLLFFLFANILGLYPVLASILSTGLTLIFSFFMNHHFVFNSEHKWRQTLVKFVGITLLNVWLIQSAIIFIVLHSLRSHDYFLEHLWTLNLFSKLCGVSVSMVLNYLGYKSIFKGKAGDQQKEN
jgi:putative flippase GtrA